jgi:small subunit ribosomal protein S3
MIERQFVDQNFKEFLIQEYIANSLKRCGISHIKLQKTPLGEKIIIFASRPGLIVGRKGANINKLTKDLKKDFGLENPQIEISEVYEIHLDPQVVADMIAASLERFGTAKFKGVGHKMMSDSINAGARGIEIVISGKIPGARAKSWRFYQGYLKKCGDMALTEVKAATASAQLKTGTIGIKVKIMPPDAKLADSVRLRKDIEEEEKEEVKKSGEETKKETEESVKPAEKIEKEASKARGKKGKERKKKQAEKTEETEKENASAEA